MPEKSMSEKSMPDNNADSQVNGVQASASGPAADEPDSSGLQADGSDAAEELEALRAALSEAEDRLLRTVAEFQNYRRRTEAQKQTWTQAGREEAVLSFLDVYDDFRRSLEAVDLSEEGAPDAAAVRAWLDGITLIYSKFSDAMSKQGVRPIEAVGEPFDPDLHDALLSQPAPEGTPSGTVLAEVQRGFRMNDRILRHTQVVVAE